MTTEAGILSPETEAEEQITRFDIHQIIQHAILMVSFILLVVTGVPLKFHDWAISQWWVALWGGIESTRTTHFFAAWAMVLVCFYHLFYLFYGIAILKRPFPIKMVPSGQDFVKLVQELGYFLGVRREMPKNDRFNWKEKFDYWAIFWGIPVMAGSGFILMFPVMVTRFLPGWVVPAALVAHSDEAMLALTWIFMVHIFFNHFSPGVFPINTSIFTGKVARERYRREHTLEFEQLTAADEVIEEEEEEDEEEEEEKKAEEN
ncbi:MAG: cytochrome b/b6 domain-containing protein [Dehalococcoidia bacterium]|nr:cytochrome b/b6 domain-containing protein [Dehalococcoidia bacterium]